MSKQTKSVISAGAVPWSRMLSIGDSFTEGIGDANPDSTGGLRGWADRVAEQLGQNNPEFGYANLAVRGRLLQQILDEQLQPALNLKPDLVTLSAGGNDLIRPGGDPDTLAIQLEEAVGALRKAGATVVLFNGPDTSHTPVLNLVRSKVGIYNSNLHAIAVRHDAVFADMWAMRNILNNPPMWADDRLHFSAMGHHAIAMMVLDALSVNHSLTPQSVPELPSSTWRHARAADLYWAKEHLLPWVVRRIKHQSSGDHISAKRPQFLPVDRLPDPKSKGA